MRHRRHIKCHSTYESIPSAENISGQVGISSFILEEITAVFRNAVITYRAYSASSVDNILSAMIDFVT